MSEEIKIPQMGESISEATIGTLLKPSGSFVRRDEEIIELETDKVNQVLYAPEEGVLHLLVKAGDVVKIGQVIGTVEKGEAPSPPAKEPEVIAKPQETLESARISKESFVKALSEPPKVSAVKPKGKETRKPLSRIRRVIAERLVEVKQTTAMLTTFNEVDMSRVLSLREEHQELFTKKYGVKLGFMAFFVKASVFALNEMPMVNAYIDGDEMVERHTADIGIAVSTERGLVVPVLRDAARLSFAETEIEIASFAKKAREGGLTVDDLQGASFTITNGGVYGSLLSTPLLNPPGSAILGMHKIEKRAVVVDDQIVIRPMMYVALSYDHRVIDGKEAVGFLAKVKEAIEDPARILLEI